MKRIIKKVAVLGSGVMGSRIACHFANIGVEVLLLDISPAKLTDAEANNGLSLDHPAIKNKIVNEALQNAIKSKPSPLYHPKFASFITTGNFDDDLASIKDCEWVIEVVVENFKIKQQLFEKVDALRSPCTLVSSNTSGIPINLMAKGRSEDFIRHFCGTHFFNPPRYLKLLEIIPGEKTDKEVLDFLVHYGDLFLGKTTVVCKDSPAFIANRIGIFSILKVVESMQKLGLNIDEVDKLTGPVIGRPKSATFRTSDVVGLDTLIKVANNLYEALVHDEQRELFKLPGFVLELEKKGWLGEKTNQGFYKKVKGQDGKSEILSLDLKTFEYQPKGKSNFPTLELTKAVDRVKDRFKILVSGKDKAAEFYRDSFFGIFQYVSFRIPEIADELYKIDQAVCAGFGWEYGPFETWDAIGLKNSISMMETVGYKPADWIYKMLENGHDAFYKVENGLKSYYDVTTNTYKRIPGTEGLIILDHIRNSNTVWSNSGSTLFDLGDGILNLEFHTKMNTMGGEVIEGINKAIDIAEKEFEGLVIGNDGANFSAGANLGMVFMMAVDQEFDELNMMINTFQQTMMRARYSSIPVIVAPHGMTLGGGCELTLHADAVQAAAETYIGLVEVGVGLLPAGGGTKELAMRMNDRYINGDVEYNALQEALMNIATAKVATSAHEAFDMFILQKGDRISINGRRQLADAKQLALHLKSQGYTQPTPRKNIKVQGRGGQALFLAGIQGMLTGNYISEHDAKIAKKIAHVICGGDLSSPAEVSEQYLLDLEREAFLSLCAERKTLERIQSILNGGKPLRN